MGRTPLLMQAALECGADHADENLVARPRVEPIAANRDGAEGHLRERTALDIPLAAIDLGALARNSQRSHSTGRKPNSLQA